MLPLHQCGKEWGQQGDPEHAVVAKRQLRSLIVDVQPLVRRAGFEMMRGVKRQFHERPSREAVTTLPGVGGVGALIIPSPKAVVLQIIHELEEVNGHEGLADVSNQVHPTEQTEDEQEGCFKQQGAARVHRSRPKGSLHLTRHRLEHVGVDAATPGRGRGVHISCPVSVMRVVVFRREVKVKHRKKREASRPPTLRLWPAMAEFMRGHDAGGPVAQPC